MLILVVKKVCHLVDLTVITEYLQPSVQCMFFVTVITILHATGMYNFVLYKATGYSVDICHLSSCLLKS
jgi:hypothetical protein